jgi:hypothetical protein
MKGLSLLARIKMKRKNFVSLWWTASGSSLQK